MTPSDLNTNEYQPYFGLYIGQAPAMSIVEGLEKGEEYVVDLLRSVPKEKEEYRYAAGKWTIKEMLLHIIDTERIFAYRALRVARGDKVALPGYEQDDYVGPSKANSRSMDDLIADYQISRRNTIALFKSFDATMLAEIGTASGGPISAGAAGYIIVGHELHHCKVLKERYL